MRAIELARQYNWDHLWLELDSSLVVNAFNNHALVPWKLRNQWSITKSMQFIVSHIYREGNQCADTLANLGLNFDVYTVWLQMLSCIRSFVAQNKLGMPNYRFVNY